MVLKVCGDPVGNVAGTGFLAAPRLATASGGLKGAGLEIMVYSL